MLIARAQLDGKTVTGYVDGSRLRILGSNGIDETTVDLSEVELLPPVDPARVLIMLGGFLPEGTNERIPGANPWLYPKGARGYVGHGAPVVWPSHVDRVDAEVEIAIVIGQKAENIEPARAWEAIVGFTCFNDLTAPQFLKQGPDLHRAKSIPGFCSFGPWIRTDLSQRDLDDGLELTARVNGEVVQRGNTRRMRFAVADVVAVASRYTTLQPGDLIALGTPPPAAPVSIGDLVEIEVESIGLLRNTIVAPRPVP